MFRGGGLTEGPGDIQFLTTADTVGGAWTCAAGVVSPGGGGLAGGTNVVSPPKLAVPGGCATKGWEGGGYFGFILGGWEGGGGVPGEDSRFGTRSGGSGGGRTFG